MDVIFNGNWKFDYLYTPVEYIENKSDAYINTGIVIEKRFKDNILFMDILFGVDKGRQLFGFYGSSWWDGLEPNLKFFWYKDKEGKLNRKYRYIFEYHQNSDGTYRLTHKLDDDIRVQDGLTPPPYPFKTNLMGGYGMNYGRIYNITCISDNNVTHNLVPAVRNDDGEVGLYDKITGEFFGSATKSKFKPGPKLI